VALRRNVGVIAARNIERDQDVCIAKGTPGRILRSGGIITLKYSVMFHPSGGNPVIVDRLTWRDVQETYM